MLLKCSNLLTYHARHVEYPKSIFLAKRSASSSKKASAGDLYTRPLCTLHTVNDERLTPDQCLTLPSITHHNAWRKMQGR